MVITIVETTMVTTIVETTMVITIVDTHLTMSLVTEQSSPGYILNALLTFSYVLFSVCLTSNKTQIFITSTSTIMLTSNTIVLYITSRP